ESFRLKAELSDDAGLRRYVINRVKRDGTRAVEYEYTYSVACPEPLIRHELKTSEIVFNQSEPTEYEVLLEDNAGQITRRAFLIHPLANVVPEIRITTPAEGQYIAAGTFRVKINIVASDDRELTTDNLDIFANGVRLDLIESLDGEPGGKEVIEQAFNDIYDSLEEKYTVDIANEFGRSDSPYAISRSFLFGIPAGLIRDNESITLTAQIKDSDCNAQD